MNTTPVRQCQKHCSSRSLAIGMLSQFLHHTRIGDLHDIEPIAHSQQDESGDDEHGHTGSL